MILEGKKASYFLAKILQKTVTVGAVELSMAVRLRQAKVITWKAIASPPSPF